MRIGSLTIENFRCFKKATVVFDDYTCFVGPNGTGKSTILTALNVFFRETVYTSTDTLTLAKEDFHLCDTSQPIKIEVTFEELSPSAQEDFKDYFRNDKLIVSAVGKWNEISQSAPVKQYGDRLGIQEFRGYFDQDKAGAKAPELQAAYDALRAKYPDLPLTKTKPAKEEALHAYESNHPEKCELIQSEDQFYGVSRGVDRLNKHVQWVYVPAVKDASEEQEDKKNTAIGKLLARRVHSKLDLDDSIEELKKTASNEYQKLIEGKKDALKALSDDLNLRFHKWAHAGADLNIDWQNMEKNVSITPPSAEVKATEKDFKGSLVRFGHGLQRSFIFAILQELAEHADTGPRLLLACEEPELYQHPPQARYLAGVMQQLTESRII